MSKNYLPALAFILVPRFSNAADSESVDHLMLLEPVVVTATRTAETEDETLASVTVITRSDIERQQAKTIEELLNGVPGVQVVNNGGMGKATSVFLRGTESDHTLFLFDGIKIGSATLGTAAIQHIPIEHIERIEIVRGPRSSLYGSEAIGGVIQIFTRKGGGEVKPFASVGVGSYHTYNASVGVSGGGIHGWYNVMANAVGTDGFNACNGRPSPEGAGCFTTEPDNDGYNNSSGSIRAGYRFTNNTVVDIHWLRTNGEAEFDGNFVNGSESTQQITGGSLRFMPTKAWNSSVNLGRSKDISDNFKNGIYQTTFKTERDSIAWQNDIKFVKDQIVTLGIDYLSDKVDGTTNYSIRSRNNSAVFAQYQLHKAVHNLQLSARQDDNEQFGQYTTGGIAWGYARNTSLRFLMSYGTAYKAPNFNELYFPGFGNADLGPEESTSFEIGLRGAAGWGNWSLNAYETRIDNLIAYDSSISAPDNIENAKIRGLETVLSGNIKKWAYNTSLTLLDPINLSDSTNRGNVLPRRSRQSFRFDIDRFVGNTGFGATLFADSKRYDDLSNTRELDGYAIVNLRTEYLINNEWTLKANIENVFDKNYETAAYFNQPRRGLYLSLHYQH